MTKIYGKTTPEFFILWQGTNGTPEKGTVNDLLGYNCNLGTYRYTMPILHKNTICDYDEYGMPIIDTIRQKVENSDPLIRDYVFVVDDKCPENLEKDGITYNKLTELLEFMSSTYGKTELYSRDELSEYFEEDEDEI